ncbi:hypothetical protein CSIRO_2054 [Bradyrhizobiaceae bacterium SG-6C]|nr:hypothetical protein CSIRO_2054 [Bradyrhizobiaceae bacterium SG-6C]
MRRLFTSSQKRCEDANCACKRQFSPAPPKINKTRLRSHRGAPGVSTATGPAAQGLPSGQVSAHFWLPPAHCSYPKVRHCRRRNHQTCREARADA